MSTYNEFCGVVYVKNGVTVDDVAAAITAAIGPLDREIFLPVDEVIVRGDDQVLCAHIDFGMIPSEGASTEIVERAMWAVAPFVDLGPEGTVEIEMVPGMNWADARMYRFVQAGDRVVLESSSASLRSDGDWSPISTATNQMSSSSATTSSTAY